jgi:putative DNA primase/helicase
VTTAPSRPPDALPVLIEQIPPELLTGQQFVSWDWEQRDGKWTKPLKNPRNGWNASHADPTTWGTATEAMTWSRRHNLPGIGRVLVKEDGLTGIDLDKCRNRETGEIQQWALDVVQRFDSYTEVSPSGTGLRIFVRASLPAGGRRTGAIEVYDQLRYLTLTGHRLDGVSWSVRDRQSELDAWLADAFPAKEAPTSAPRPAGGPVSLDDAELLQKARYARNGGRFSALFDSGDTSGYAGDHSAADQALSNMLVFWTSGDVDRADQLFRQSALFRDKWDEVHYSNGDTHGRHTLNTALAGATAFYEPQAWTSPILDASDIDIVDSPPSAIVARYEALLRLKDDRIQELERTVAAQQVMAADAIEVKRTLSALRQAMRNPELKPVEKLIAIETFIRTSGERSHEAAAGGQDDGFAMVTVAGENGIAAAVGVSSKTASSAIQKFSDVGLWRTRTETARVEVLDRETGELTYRPQTRLFIETHGSPVEGLQRIATLSIVRPERKVGSGLGRHCDLHPEADLIERHTIQCSKCYSTIWAAPERRIAADTPDIEPESLYGKNFPIGEETPSIVDITSIGGKNFPVETASSFIPERDPEPVETIATPEDLLQWGEANGWPALVIERGLRDEPLKKLGLGEQSWRTFAARGSQVDIRKALAAIQSKRSGA